LLLVVSVINLKAEVEGPGHVQLTVPSPGRHHHDDIMILTGRLPGAAGWDAEAAAAE
jgi:hypothetical protein